MIPSEKAYYIVSPNNDLINPEQLSASLCPNPEALKPIVKHFPMRISSHLLPLLQETDDPLARQFIPDPEELQDTLIDIDPLAETKQSPTPLVIHRYPKRVIFLVSTRCAAHCRFCMRKRNATLAPQIDPAVLTQSLAYIQSNRQINEVILSGGDPLMLRDSALLDILSALRTISHVRILRIHTRLPIVWPQRISPSLVKRLSDLHPLYINIHVNHPREITPEAARACELLANVGIPLGSQTVLLSKINDDAEVLSNLFESLLQIRVHPYYLHQIDRVSGTAHFRVPIDRGLALIRHLHGHLSGMAMPHFMIDLPGGGGKVELLPEYVINKQAHQWQILNFKGKPFKVYPDA